MSNTADMFNMSVSTKRGSMLPVLLFKKDSPSSFILNTLSTFLLLRTFLKPDGLGV